MMNATKKPGKAKLYRANIFISQNDAKQIYPKNKLTYCQLEKGS